MTGLATIIAFALWGSCALAQPVDTVWTRSFMSCEPTDAILAIAEFPTGGVIVAGTSVCGIPCGYVQRISDQPDTLWTLSLYDQGVWDVRDLLVRDDGRILFIGMGFGNVGADRMETGMIDSLGNLMWINHDTTFFFVGAAICPSRGESFVTASYSLSFSQDDDILVQHHLNEDSVTWSLTIGSPVRERAVDIEPLGNGYVLLGDRPSELVVRGLDSLGGILWTQELGPAFHSEGGGLTVIGDTLIAVTGTLQPNAGSGRTQAYLGILNSQGEPQSEWMSQAGSTLAGKDCGLTPSGKIILAGHQYFDATTYDGYLACFTMACSLEWSLTTGGSAFDRFNDVLVLGDTDFIAGGVTTRAPECLFQDDWLVRFGQATSVISPSRPTPSSITLLSVFPNPFNPTTTISFTLPSAQTVNIAFFDVTGRTVQNISHSRFPAGEHELTFDGSALPSGIYFAQLQAGNFTQTRKLVLLK